MKKILVLIIAAMLAGCGGQQQRASGIVEETLLVIRAERLVGATVVVEPVFERVVTEQDLTPYQLGVLGAADREEERLQTLTLKVDPGEHRVSVTLDGQVKLDQRLYFSKGQTRELRVR